MMKNLFKKLFTVNETNPIEHTPPGRTFKRVLTGDYFGHKDTSLHHEEQRNAQSKKIEQIKELHLVPKYIKYTYEGLQTISVYVIFQKEVLAKKWNMLHITEISFTVHAEDFKIFESMASVSIEKDFRDITPLADLNYQGEERRITART